jgi:hypothetical protein
MEKNCVTYFHELLILEVYNGRANDVSQLHWQSKQKFSLLNKVTVLSFGIVVFKITHAARGVT